MRKKRDVSGEYVRDYLWHFVWVRIIFIAALAIGYAILQKVIVGDQSSISIQKFRTLQGG